MKLSRLENDLEVIFLDLFSTLTNLEMEEIIYQTKVFTPLNSLLALLLGLLFLILGITFYNDPSVILEDDYPSLLFLLGLFWLCIIISFKKFIFTENEFIVKYPPFAFILTKRIPLNDIEKLVFKENEGPRGFPKIQIYRASSKWITNYSFNLDKDEIQKLINMLRSKGVQVECVGYAWK